ncbi:MAG: hypothetical protein LAQ30_01940 [Acidobacteriia bacterium]|nr:hypothetical protein [Terriglobia bacterium]
MQSTLTPTPREPRKKGEEMAPPNGSITIKIDPTGRPFCDPYYAEVHAGDQVGWNFEGPWTIVFKNRTPLQDGQHVVHGYDDKPQVTTARDAHGHYPYSLSALGVDDSTFGKPTKTIFCDVACPEMIFD